MDLWLIKQSKSVESDIDVLGATSFAVDGSPTEKKKRRVRKYETDFLIFGFTYQLVNGEEHPQYVVCGEVSQAIISMQGMCLGTYQNMNVLQINHYIFLKDNY
jgi:hypothetical protein